jgi:hypothetical protein
VTNRARGCGPALTFSASLMQWVSLKPKLGVTCFWRLLILVGWPGRKPLSRAENPAVAFIRELKKQVRVGLLPRGEGQSAIPGRADAVHGTSRFNATEQDLVTVGLPERASLERGEADGSRTACLTWAGANRPEASGQGPWNASDLRTRQAL